VKYELTPFIWTDTVYLFEEIRSAGFTQVEAKPSLELKDNFFAVFLRNDLDSKSSTRAVKE
jgi:hypothetical protein